jgi:MFS family permease
LPRLHTLDAWLQYRDFRFLWVANFCGNSALWLQLLSVGWLVKSLSEDSAVGGLLVVSVGAINTLPSLVVNPLTGVLGDRLDRRKLVMTMNALGAALALGFAFLVDSELIRAWHAYAYVLISGALLSITQPLQQVLVSNTVPREAVGNAYAINVLTVTGTRIFGPFVGGLIIFWLGFFWNFALEGALYLAVVLMMIPMKVNYTMSVPGIDGQRFSPLADLRDGIMHLWRRQREILQMMVLAVVPNTILHPVWFLLPLFTAQALHAEADMGGYLLAATGVGGLISTLTIASFGLPPRKGYILLATAGISSVCTMAFSHSSWLPAAFVFLALMSLFQAHYRTTQGTVVLTIVPDQFRARTMAILAYERGFLTGASVLVGMLADATSASTAILTLGGLGLVLTAVCAAVLQRVRALD